MATTTPSPSQLPPDTPPTGYRSGDLSLARDAILKDLKYCLQVPYVSLLHSIFGSPLPDIAHICQKLVDINVLDSNMTKWTADTPTRSQAKEREAFQPIVDIISKIFDQVPQSHVFAVEDPNVVPLSERKNTSRPDAYIVHKCPAMSEGGNVTRGDNQHWFDIAVSFEFKKAGSEPSEKDNEEKIIWSMHNVMREDPRRRFALGITIEKTRMRLWCNSRALVVVSEPIDFCNPKEIPGFISLFYLIGMSTEEQLGWDPTVKRIRTEKGIQYMFKISGHSFITTRVLASYGADVIVGRGTRVYEAQDEAKNIVAIKDSWRDEDRDSEGAILENIFGDIRDKLGEEEATKAKKFFVTVRDYEDVIVSGANDITFSFGNSEHFEWLFVKTDPVSGRRHLPSIGHISDVDQLTEDERPQPPKDIPRRIHTRTVFEQVGTPLHAITSLAENFTCLSGARKALYYLHKAGWMHRDFGVGNLLWFESEGIGKLTDFEFAKKVNSGVSHEERTGTMNFMAIEVEKQGYLFAPAIRVANRLPFRVNFLHDLESMWWTSIWILFHHTDKNSPTLDPIAQLRYFRQAFPSAIGKGSRQNFFSVFQDRGYASETLSDTYRNICGGVIDLPDVLKTFYEVAEKSYPVIKVDDDVLEDVHRKVSDIYSDAVKKLEDYDIHLIPVHKLPKKEPEPSRGAKRAKHK